MLSVGGVAGLAIAMVRSRCLPSLLYVWWLRLCRTSISRWWRVSRDDRIAFWPFGWWRAGKVSVGGFSTAVPVAKCRRHTYPL